MTDASRNRRFVRAGALTAVLAAAAVAACESILPGPSGSGVIQVSVTSPFGPEGAAVFELTGGVDLGPVTTNGGDTFFEHSAGVSRIVVLLDEPGQIWFQVRTTDIAKLPTVRVLQVADGEDRLRPSVSGYEFDFERVEDMSSARQLRAP
ncbi:MAG: hypothetical protein IH616_23615 [Gemmatimonadales bacterium]|nr:hypothetical protein [Gemmatimonadales bacterium]